MGLQSWQETLLSSQVDGPTLASFTTAVTMLPGAAHYTLPANYFCIGKALRITVAGRISNVVTSQPTFTFDIRMGPTSNIIVFNGGAMTTATTVHTSVPFIWTVWLTCRAIGNGTTANLMGQARMESQAFVVSGATGDSANTHTTLLTPNSAPAVGTGFDSTVSMVVDAFATCQTSAAGNGLTVHQYILEALN